MLVMLYFNGRCVSDVHKVIAMHMKLCNTDKYLSNVLQRKKKMCDVA